jgi:hypothetical protein
MLLDNETSWKWVLSFTPRPLFLWGKSPRYPFDRKLSESWEPYGQVQSLDSTGTRNLNPRLSYIYGASTNSYKDNNNHKAYPKIVRSTHFYTKEPRLTEGALAGSKLRDRDKIPNQVKDRDRRFKVAPNCCLPTLTRLILKLESREAHSATVRPTWIYYYLQKPTSEFVGTTTAACYHSIRPGTVHWASERLNNLHGRLLYRFQLVFRNSSSTSP